MAHASSWRFPSRTTETIYDPACDAIYDATHKQSVDGGVGTGAPRCRGLRCSPRGFGTGTATGGHPTACGGTESAAEPEPVADIDAGSSPTATATPLPTESPAVELVDLYFIREDGLVPLASDVAVPTDAQTVLDRLAAGPPVETGLRSVVVDPLTGTALVSVFTPTGDTDLPTASVTIAVANAFSSLPPTEQVLLLGQVVLSLSSAGFATVSVVDAAGAPLAVPLPDGRLLDRPATALDYASLIRPL